MATIATRREFTRLQARAQATAAAETAYRHELSARYSYHGFAPAAHQRRLDRLQERARAASDAYHALLVLISPRDWTRGIPAQWVRERLTWDDAITSGALSVIPPAAYQYTERDSRAFAAPLAQATRTE